MAKEKRETKYVRDDKGKRVGVIVEIQDYKMMREALEELESIRAYDLAKASGDEAVPFEQAMQEIKKKR